MKQLFLLRHAKTELIRYDITDFDRNLKERGINDAQLISKKLLLRNSIPELIISSSANRAIQTATLFAKTLEYQEDQIVEVSQLYDGMTTNDFLEQLSKYGDHKNSIMIVGHNPTIEYLAFNLSKEFYKSVPTCTLIGIQFPVDDWKDIEVRTGEVFLYEYPKKYK